MKKLVLVAAILCISACATNPDKVGAKYVSTTEYSNYSCDQIREEYRRTTSDLEKLDATMKTLHRKNTAAVTIGAIIFWPALFFAKSKNQTNDEALAELKGRHEALEVQARRCDQNSYTQKRDQNNDATYDPQPILYSDSIQTTSSLQVELPTSAQPRAVTKEEKESCGFIKTITSGAGGSGDTSQHTEKAMNSALAQAAKVGADSYFVVNVDTTATGASVILEALKCS